jgi:branched-chain amino acid transport system permease protein
VIAQILLNGVVSAGPIALIAIGLSLIYRVTRVFHLAHAAIYALAAYTAFTLIKIIGLTALVSLPLAILIAAALGTAIEVFIYRPLRRIGATPLALFVSSLAIIVVGQNLLSLFFGNQTLTIRSPAMVAVYRFLGIRITDLQIITIILSLAVSLGTGAVIKWTQVGRILRGVASDAGLATIVGIPCERYIAAAFTLASAAAGLASILVAYETDLTPLMGFDMLLFGLTASVIGGIDSIPGAALGALLVGLSYQLAGWFLTMQWQDAVVFILLILFLLVRPHGLLGKPLRKAQI